MADMDVRRIDIEGLGTLLNERAGLKLHADGEFGLTTAMRARMRVLQMISSAQYMDRVRGAEGDQELHLLLPLVTVGKTDFFRDERQFDAFAQKLMPDAVALSRRERRPARLWSAGCATGEEPYSLAMLGVEAGLLQGELDILASDINPEAVVEARKGTYPLRRLRPVPPARLRRFFLTEGASSARVSNELQQYIRFEVRNLAEGLFPTPPGGFDLILCRNVLIYFDAETMVRVLDGFYEALRPGGYLALGYSESLFRVYNRFELVEVMSAFLYRRPVDAAAPGLLPPRPGAASARPTSRPERPTPITVPAVPPLPQRPISSANKSVLPPGKRPITASMPSLPSEAKPATVSAGASTDVPPEFPHRLSRSVELVERGHFDEALDLLLSLTRSEPESLIGWVTMGNVLSVMRRFSEAFVAYDTALSLEPLSAEARVFFGIALYEGLQYDDARRELARALFLDGDVALAHYYLGRSAEAGKDLTAARRAYRNCLTLCQNKRPTRPFLAYYPDLPKDFEVLARAAEYALKALG
jgi:chemotaxis protein methyltransferase CheR